MTNKKDFREFWWRHCASRRTLATTKHRNKGYKFWSQLECTNKTSTKRIIKPGISYIRLWLEKIYDERLSRELIPAVWYNLINRKRVVKQRDWFVGIKEVLIASENPFTAFVSFMRSKTNSLVCIEIFLSQLDNHTSISRVNQVILSWSRSSIVHRLGVAWKRKQLWLIYRLFWALKHCKPFHSHCSPECLWGLTAGTSINGVNCGCVFVCFWYIE